MIHATKDTSNTKYTDLQKMWYINSSRYVAHVHTDKILASDIIPEGIYIPLKVRNSTALI